MRQITRPSSNASPPILLTLFVITLVPLYLFSYHYRTLHPYGGANSSSKPATPSTSSLTSSSSSFIQSWLATHLIHPFDPAPIAIYCNRTTPTWNPNLVLSLYNANGGIGNTRGNILDFLFIAIELGASILVPGMAARDSNNLSNVWGGGRVEFGSMFDEQWFVHILGQACPQLKVYKVDEGMELVEAVEGIWRSRSRRLDENIENSADALRKALDDWLKGNEDFQRRYGDGSRPDRGGEEGEGGGEEEEAILLNLERTLWDVDTRSLPRGLRRNFGQLVKVAPVYRGLAALITWRLHEKFNLEVDPSKAIPPGAFYGAHLRTADDAKNAGWLTAEGMNATAQMNEYIAHAREHDLHVIYVASGNPADIKLFQKRAGQQKPPIIVTDKFDLLPAHEAQIVQDMSWDQQALIDWEVLKRCSVFGGIVKSSFAFNIALTRNQYLEDRSVVGDPWGVQHSEDNVAFDDGLSRVFGRDAFHEQRIPRGMWP